MLELLAARLEALVERRASSMAASCSQEVRGPACCRPSPAWSGCAMREYLVRACAYIRVVAVHVSRRCVQSGCSANQR